MKAMEPVIPINVHEELVSDASLMGLTLNGSADDTYRNMTIEDARQIISQLSDENYQLKVNLQDANMAMKNACEAMGVHKENERQKQKVVDERFAQAKAKIESMKQTIADREKLIDELQKQQSSTSHTANGVSDLQIDNLNKTIVQANQMALQYKQKLDQANQQLILERTQRTQLLTQLETSNKQMTQLREELSASQLRIGRMQKSADENGSSGGSQSDGQTIENLRSHIATLQTSLAAEKDRNTLIQKEFTQLKLKHEELLSDYHDLMVESDNKGDKAAEMDTLKKDYDQRLDNLTAQIYVAEDTLAMRDSQIDALKQRLRELESLQRDCQQKQEQIDMLNAQVHVYRTDFEAERRSREQFNDKCLQLQEKVGRLEDELSRLRLQQPRYVEHTPTRSATLGRSGGGNNRGITMGGVGTTGGIGDWGAVVTPEGAVGGVGAIVQEETGGTSEPVSMPLLRSNPTNLVIPAWIPPDPSHSPELLRSKPVGSQDEPDMRCPVCDVVYPDYDSLQLHCNECLERLQPTAT